MTAYVWKYLHNIWLPFATDTFVFMTSNGTPLIRAYNQCSVCSCWISVSHLRSFFLLLSFEFEFFSYSNILISIQIMSNCKMFCEQYFSVSKTFVEQFQVLSLFFLLELQKLCRRFSELPTLTLPNVKYSLPWNSFSLRFEMQR